jgi:general secretion pathway protein E
MSLADRIPEAFARLHGLLPIADEGAAVHVLLAPTVSVDALSEARRLLAKPLRSEAVSADRFAQSLASVYQNAKPWAAPNKGNADSELLSAEQDAPTIAKVNQLLLSALHARASDIHIEPQRSHCQVRYRVDGVLQKASELTTADYQAVVARLKVMASLDLAEKRLPQDGRMRLALAERTVDVRIATLPSAEGERVVLRLLDTANAALDLSSLGMNAAHLSTVKQLLNLPHGLILVTGPTGSGKTTSLYAMLAALSRQTHNIMTVEDPIEYSLEGVAQTAVQLAIGLDFARALRALLRQDPDIVMVGEIRDSETAQIAVQASLTGHLVFATLHTNDAASAIDRLLDMGVEAFLLSASLRAVIAQRLLRQCCPECVRLRPTTAAEQAKISQHCGPSISQLPEAKGCAHCNHSGYFGRLATYEVLPMTPARRQAVHGKQALTVLPEDSLLADAWRQVATGKTTVDEVMRLASEA